MKQTYSTETLDFTQGESPIWVFDLFQDDVLIQPFGVNGYTLTGAIGYPFGNVHYLTLTPGNLFISGPNQITLSLTSAQTQLLPAGGQTLQDPPNLSLSIWGGIGSSKTPLVRSQMLNLPMVSING
jgi:hypothetical protein